MIQCLRHNPVHLDMIEVVCEAINGLEDKQKRFDLFLSIFVSWVYILGMNCWIISVQRFNLIVCFVSYVFDEIDQL